MAILLLITTPPTSKLMWQALKLAQALKLRQEVSVFFYQDAVQIANKFMWFPDDQVNIQKEWQGLGIDLPVCVSAALTRGVSDDENAQRHTLAGNNLAEGFQLVGLGVLSDLVAQAEKIIQF